MSNEITIENARTNYIRIVSDFEKETAAAAKEIEQGVKELEKLGVKEPLNNLHDLIKDKDKSKKPRRDDDDSSERTERTERTDRTERTERTERRSRRTGGPLRRGEPLPPQCKRFDEVCSEDRHVIERSDCLDRVDDLKGDEKRMAELVACYEKATTCAGFAKCSTDMWFDIQHDR